MTQTDIRGTDIQPRRAASIAAISIFSFHYRIESAF